MVAIETNRGGPVKRQLFWPGPGASTPARKKFHVSNEDGEVKNL